MQLALVPVWLKIEGIHSFDSPAHPLLAFLYSTTPKIHLSVLNGKV